MKPVIFLISIVLTGLVAITSADANISGTWLMEEGDSSTNPPVLRIKMEEGIWEGKMDMPEQQIFDRRLYSIKVDGDSVFITTYKNGTTIYARRVNDASIVGLMKGESRVDTVRLKKI